MTRHIIAAAAATVVACLSVSPCSAQETTPTNRLIELATIEITSALCHLDLSDAQTDRIAAIRSTMLDEGTTTADEIASVHDTLQAAMERQVPQGLCKPNGPGLRYYEQKLATLGVTE